LQYIIHALEVSYSNRYVALSVNYRYIRGKFLLYYWGLKGMALGSVVLLGVIAVVGGYSSLYGLWLITHNKIRFSRHMDSRGCKF